MKQIFLREPGDPGVSFWEQLMLHENNVYIAVGFYDWVEHFPRLIYAKELLSD